MKTIATYLFLAAYVLWTLVSCGPVDPVTGIRHDAPPHWQNSPETYDRIPPSHGAFGPGWLWR